VFTFGLAKCYHAKILYSVMKQCQGTRKSGMPTGRSTVPSVVEHGGRRSTL
jgi:hypothetical protein